MPSCHLRLKSPSFSCRTFPFEETLVPERKTTLARLSPILAPIPPFSGRDDGRYFRCIVCGGTGDFWLVAGASWRETQCSLCGGVRNSRYNSLLAFFTRSMEFEIIFEKNTFIGPSVVKYLCTNFSATSHNREGILGMSPGFRMVAYTMITAGRGRADY